MRSSRALFTSKASVLNDSHPDEHCLVNLPAARDL